MGKKKWKFKKKKRNNGTNRKEGTKRKRTEMQTRKKHKNNEISEKANERWGWIGERLKKAKEQLTWNVKV